MLLTCVLFAICSSQRLRLLKSNINAQLHCKIVITLNGGRRNVGRFTRAAFVADGTGSVVAEHRKIRPPLPRCKMLLSESLQSRLQLTHIWVFSDVLLWLLKIYQPEKYMKNTYRAQICHPVWRRNPPWPDLTKWPLPSFLQFLPLRLYGVQLWIAKGLNLTRQQQEGTRFVLHGWLPVTGSNSKPQQSSTLVPLNNTRNEAQLAGASTTRPGASLSPDTAALRSEGAG